MGLLPLKHNENAVFFKITENKVQGPFFHVLFVLLCSLIVLILVSIQQSINQWNVYARNAAYLMYHTQHLVFKRARHTQNLSIKNSKTQGRTQIYLKLRNVGMSVAMKKSFDSSRVTDSVFRSHTIIFRYLRLIKRPTSR